MFSKTRAIALFVVLCGSAQAADLPAIPVGLDAYRQWARWSEQRIGVRAYMRSTYDRRGGNEAADASHFLFQKAEDFNVTLDVAGAGVLYFARYNHWHGSPWHYVVDGVDTMVQETSTADPNHPAENSVFLPASSFPNPLSWTWSETRGADLSWVPIPFEKSFQMAYSRTHYGTGYYIYHQFVPGTKLSKPLRSWNTKSAPDKDVLELISRAGTDLAPKSANTLEKDFVLKPDSKFTVDMLVTEPTMLRALEFSVPRAQALDFGRATVRITWDNSALPSIEAPIGLFFGAGTLYNRDDREFLVKAFPVNIRFDRERVYLACYFPMPFDKGIRLEVVSHGTNEITGLHAKVRYENRRQPMSQLAYFHATYKDHGLPEPGKDLVLLDTRKTEGGGDWSGSFVGTSFIFSDRANLTTLEGDPRFFFDDSQTPQAQGTGTEEWGGGGDYWGGRNMTIPFAGHPTGACSEKEAANDEDKIESAYRFLLADLMPFGKNAEIHLEHGGNNDSTEHYQTVTYWYGAHHAILVQTDRLQIGDTASETDHHYNSPDSGPPYKITSRYELGVDHVNGKEIYPATTDTGRVTTNTSEFTLKIDPKNLGVMLRRKLDYSFANQRAEVFIAKANEHGEAISKWKPAGVWYLAGANTCVYSNPKDELGATQHNIETSNRSFRDDEFLLPKNMTQGASVIRVKVKFSPKENILTPTQSFPKTGWSEIRYDAYCYMQP